MNFLLGLIDERDLGLLGAHRARTDWQCCAREDGDSFWLRVPREDEAIFSRLPLSGRWTLDEAGHRYRRGCRLPEGAAIDGDWVSLAEIIAVGRMTQTAPAMPPIPVGWSLVPGSEVRPANVLFCRAERFFSWSESVLVQRLQKLEYALSDDGNCLVKGNPLPGIAGTGLTRTGRLLVPLGYALPDFLNADLVETALEIEADQLALLSPDGDWQLIPGSAWHRASRAGIRINQKNGTEAVS